MQFVPYLFGALPSGGRPAAEALAPPLRLVARGRRPQTSCSGQNLEDLTPDAVKFTFRSIPERLVTNLYRQQVVQVFLPDSHMGMHDLSDEDGNPECWEDPLQARSKWTSLGDELQRGRQKRRSSAESQNVGAVNG